MRLQQSELVRSRVLSKAIVSLDSTSVNYKPRTDERQQKETRFNPSIRHHQNLYNKMIVVVPLCHSQKTTTTTYKWVIKIQHFFYGGV